MKIRELNLNSLVVFSGVYKTGSMTQASKDLGMTQPGVTQHIRNLENILNVELFHRMGKKLMPTKEAEILHEGLNSSLSNIESEDACINAGVKLYSNKIEKGFQSSR